MAKYLSLFLFIFIYNFVVAQQPAFPNAKGGGMFATGGRGGEVYEVTNLNDTGIGSLRDAVSRPNRMVIFRIGGVINLRSRLNIAQNNITIAGQTATGDGICITGNNVSIKASNVIIRYVRFRLGDANKIEDDALSSFSGIYQNIILDHCSISWGVDEVASFYDIKNFTLQYCIVSESLFSSFHSKGNHGYGGIWGGENASYHHNLIAHHSSRPPRFQGNRYKDQRFRDSVEFSNNVIFNWGTTNSVHGGEGGAYNMRNNYYKAGPATPGSLTTSSTSNKRNRILQYTSLYIENSDTVFGGRFYIEGNFVNGYNDVSVNNWARGVHKDSYSGVDALILKNRQSMPFTFATFEPETADKAFEEVLRHAGTTFPKRDVIDERIINETRTGTATFGGSGYTSGVTKPTGIIDSPNNVGGMPEYKSAPPPMDSDKDGIPDEWETKNNLNPNNGNDGKSITVNGYSNLENYLESLVLGLISSNNLLSLENIKIFPTFSETGFIVQKDDLTQLSSILIINSSGQCVIKIEVKNHFNQEALKINTDQLASGSYIVKCITNQGVSTLKFIQL